MSSLILHGYWRSTASYRVRIGLNLKGMDWASVTHDLRLGHQRMPDYLALSPQGLTPTLQDGDFTVIQSVAILEYLEERQPTPALLPGGAHSRALVRAMAQVVACDIHPLNNLRVLKTLRETFAATEEAVSAWIARWIGDGFGALETLVARHGGDFCFGDAPTLADCCLVPQIYSAERFGVDLSPYPALMQVGARARALPAFVAARPEAQPDASHA